MGFINHLITGGAHLVDTIVEQNLERLDEYNPLVNVYINELGKSAKFSMGIYPRTRSPKSIAMLPIYLAGGLEHEFYDFPYIGNFIIPTDELIFFRGVGIPRLLLKFH